MEFPLQVLLFALLAGAAIPVGGLLARIEHLHPNWLEKEFRHFVIAFGGGALISAVALVLVPQGIKDLPAIAVAIYFALGGLMMMGIDIWLGRSKMPASNLVATLSDFLPEAIALGAALGSGGNGGVLLALLIALQNLPEGFNSYREMIDAGNIRPTRILLAFSGLAFLGPVAAGAGNFWLTDAPEAVGALSIAASGGILYIVFGDIAPQAKLRKAWLPPMGAVVGFLLGLLGHMILA